jgi:hypothetical protein
VILEMPKALQAAKQKLLFYCLSNAQIESISNAQISPYTTLYTHIADIFHIALQKVVISWKAAHTCWLPGTALA